ncbi:hypothetical protein OSB04_004680 [Centaurea solstitialis]|uniref:Uncharacterized protein n=1 Tax=Centaurea solstitialis TaxID=347529 RepID=A0AA38WP10_9ASTR|nr:hypothetical protein OSB04_004680 [Centaurea solstitialis]
MATSDKFVQPSIPKFDGHYDHWSLLMENFLRSKEMWNLVEEGIRGENVANPNEAQKKAIDEAKLKDLRVKNYLFQAIDREILETILDKSTSKGIWDSMRQKYEGSTKVKRAQLQALRREYELLSMKDGEKVDTYLARTLTIVNKMKANGDPLTSGTVVAKILRSQTPKFNYVVCSIEESNNLDTMTIDELHGSLLVHEQRMIGQQEEEQVFLKVTTSSSNRGRGRGRGGYRGRGRGRVSFDKSIIECYKCHKLGHFQSECPDWEKDANYVECDDTRRWFDGSRGERVFPEVVWFLDSELKSYDSIYHPRKGLIIRSQMRTNRMFLIKASPDCMVGNEDSSVCHKAEVDTQLWHQRFGHVNTKSLQLLHEKNLVEGLPVINDEAKPCADCLVGKQTREPFPKNDFSRKCWSYFLIEKSQAFETFKKFKVLVEKEAGVEIKCLRTDRGGEFNSSEFKSFCESNGIQRQLTVGYTPHQNGVAERKNRTILNMVRSTLNARQVPKKFWPEAVNWCIHILNRSPTAALDGCTPEEKWSNMKPSVDYFKVFGCVAHVHALKKKRKKLDDRSRKCVMFGVSEESKAYRLYDPINDKIVISKDVKFEEETPWSWGQSSTTQSDLQWEDDDQEEESGANNKADGSSGRSDGFGTGDPSNVGPSDDNQSGSLISEPVNSSQRTPQRAETNDGRGKRATKAPSWMNDYVSGEGIPSDDDLGENVVMFSLSDPSNYDEAAQEECWRLAMKQEIESIEKNHTWELCDLPMGAVAIGLKWLFKTKLDQEGKIDKRKARLVVKGYAQRQGIDYSEVFAPVARWDTIRTILALAAQRETVFVEQPQGYEIQGKEEKVYRLRKALYGLKQAPRAWYGRIERTTLDLIEEFKISMKSEFEMSDMGEMHYFLGVQVVQTEMGIHICQKKYAREILTRFNMEDCNSVKNPIVPGCKLIKDDQSGFVDVGLYRQMVGCIMYLATTRPDLMFVISLLSRYMEAPTEQHMAAMKRVLRYIRGTLNFGVYYKKTECDQLMAFFDSDYAGDYDNRRSTSGYVCFFNGAAIAWSSKRQPIVTLSTTEAEFVAATACACQVVWLRRILEHIGLPQEERTIVNCDNMSTIKLSRNPVMHNRSKHIDVKHYFLRDLVSAGVIELEYCNTQAQVADIMTKPLKLEQFVKLRGELGMVEIN